MICNVGNLDRLIRLVMGVGLFLLPYLTGSSVLDVVPVRLLVMAFGAALALSSVFRFCPLYRLLGISTCRV
ncbi:hypothetical protein TG4357_00574 [Thalassovita gelatinovora]|uniref:Inner membrane protein YgaP-like transmembrane domain-containing protein n=1 Tax=Thalassovita gelatinovora TaxID=53501 RepID=A0A0N7LUE5_THAGE|nr:DUF2892 domain-containing protein [Thalassovita gelatinovora]QIZ80842.1 DUF2892 domain-containing protein [Thalassovita gelatinovora]CUH63274.1 hypothetical protein TG4357_00574 [Thalassovita gelatinovora]SEQ64442.1 Protein of unknown function [Thalassovita gelatinovora]